MIGTFLYSFFFILINLDLLTLVGMIVAVGLLFSKRALFGKKLLLITFSIFLFVNVSPVGPWMIMKLEDMVARPPLPHEKDISGIIVLGGVLDLLSTKERGEPVYNKVASRLQEAASLAQHYPHTKIILTGNALEGRWAERALTNLGISKNRLIIENESRGTEDHPQKLETLLDKSKAYLLVTSAFHMPRGLLLFEGMKYKVIPYPVDYQTSGVMSFSSWASYTLQRLTPMAFKQACIEWAGLTTYYINGLTKSWYPTRSE